MLDQGKLKLEFPSPGWKQFLTSRTEMLGAFDRARVKASVHEVEVHHGNLAEAEFRKWLCRFLPKRYSVTPGFIVSPGLESTQASPHFDVIIYDHLQAPVLWIEDSPDSSSQGSPRAIPVEFVLCVLEVKAVFSSTTVGQAIEHLGVLAPVLRGVDHEQDKYKLYLPPSFVCGVVFFDLKSEDQFSQSALDKAAEGGRLRGFFGGMILRGEAHEQELTGRILRLNSSSATTGTVGKNKESLFNSPLSNSVEVGENVHVRAMLHWSKSNFAEFAFDLIAMMQGTFEPGRISSHYGLVR